MTGDELKQRNIAVMGDKLGKQYTAPFCQLSDDELRIERANLEVWFTPQEFHNKVDALAAKFSLEDRFNLPRLAFLRIPVMVISGYRRS
jgi:hypothetical protein